MKKPLRHSFRVDAPLEHDAELLCSPDYNIESEKLRREPISTEYRLNHDAGSRIVFELHTVEGARTRAGKPDRSRRVTRVTRFSYSPAERRLSWKLCDEGRARIEVTGSYRLTCAAQGTRLEREVDIEVRVPLAGGAIAAVIERQLEESWPAQQSLFRQLLAER